MVAKRYPLPKRFNAALSEQAYDNLRKLNKKYGYGNNYLLTILLESFDDIVNQEHLDKAFCKFAEQYGAPKIGSMNKSS